MPTADVQAKKIERRTAGGNQLQSFRTLLNELATQCQNTCEFGGGRPTTPIVKLAKPTLSKRKPSDFWQATVVSNDRFLIDVNLIARKKQLQLHYRGRTSE